MTAAASGAIFRGLLILQFEIGGWQTSPNSGTIFGVLASEGMSFWGPDLAEAFPKTGKIHLLRPARNIYAFSLATTESSVGTPNLGFHPCIHISDGRPG